MADFCFECTEEMWEAENGPRNDMRHSGAPSWALCESCGLHLFAFTGRRMCGRPQSDFVEDGTYAPSWPMPCAKCVAIDEEVTG